MNTVQCDSSIDNRVEKCYNPRVIKTKEGAPVMKPMLSIEGQIDHLKGKGVRFTITDESAAKDYLTENNNYFKLRAYRKNYDKHPDGKHKGEYINLEFAYLKDLAIIDMRLRYQIIHMALDIEHHAKLDLLRKMEAHKEDGYQVVQDYVDSLDMEQRGIYNGEMRRSKKSLYCGDIAGKYDGGYPVWAFIEVIPFGRLVGFYDFCAKRFSDNQMRNNYFRLLTCKEIRNAAAHSNCILNDLRANTATHKTNADVTAELMRIEGMNANFRKNRMSNARIQQIVTLFYMHKIMVKSLGLKQSAAKELRSIADRMVQHRDYYQTNRVIQGTFGFLKLVIDKWFPIS